MYSNDIVFSLNNEEKLRFIEYLSSKNRRKDTKNIQLFKLLSSGEYDTTIICQKLYGRLNRSAYHALRKRLFESLIDFTANISLDEESSIEMQVIKYLLAARAFLLQKNYKIAYKILDKAEALANEHLLYPILNEIYHTKIQYAYAIEGIDLNTIIQKQEHNQKQHQLEDRLNIVYAKVKNTLNAISYKGEVIDFEQVLNEALEAHNIEVNDSLTYKSLYQILAIVNISAFVSSNYLRIESFVLNTYHAIRNNKDKDKQLYYHIHIVYIIANTLFRNKKFKASTEYINTMKALLVQKNKKYYRQFILKHHLVKALNLNYSGYQDEAIALIESIINNKHHDLESLLDLHLSLIMFYFQKEDLKQVKRIISKFYHTDKWYIEKAGIDWVMKKNLCEIILYSELKEEDLFYSRLASFKRSYGDYLIKINQKRVLTFLNFVERFYKNPREVIDEKFIQDVEQSFVWTKVREEDIFVMSFYAWLKAKMEQKPTYIVTLGLIKSA